MLDSQDQTAPLNTGNIPDNDDRVLSHTHDNDDNTTLNAESIASSTSTFKQPIQNTPNDAENSTANINKAQHLSTENTATECDLEAIYATEDEIRNIDKIQVSTENTATECDLEAIYATEDEIRNIYKSQAQGQEFSMEERAQAFFENAINTSAMKKTAPAMHQNSNNLYKTHRHDAEHSTANINKAQHLSQHYRSNPTVADEPENNTEETFKFAENKEIDKIPLNGSHVQFDVEEDWEFVCNSEETFEFSQNDKILGVPNSPKTLHCDREKSPLSDSDRMRAEDNTNLFLSTKENDSVADDFLILDNTIQRDALSANDMQHDACFEDDKDGFYFVEAPSNSANATETHDLDAAQKTETMNCAHANKTHGVKSKAYSNQATHDAIKHQNLFKSTFASTTQEMLSESSKNLVP